MSELSNTVSEKQFDYLITLYDNYARINLAGKEEFGDDFDFVNMTRTQASRLIELRKFLLEGKVPPGKPDPNIRMDF